MKTKLIPMSIIALFIISTVASAQGADLSLTTRIGPAPIACTYVDSSLSFGMQDKTSNGSVVNVQAFLYAKGYLQVQPTGYFGPLTLRAVKNFQTEYGLPITGFFGPLSREKMRLVTCGQSTNQNLLTTVVTDKESYVRGENIKMSLSIVNTSSSTVSMKWSNGCTTHYTIDDTYNSQAVAACMMVVVTKDLAPNQSFTWELEHPATAYELIPGSHTITAYVDGYGQASKTITVK